MIEEAADLPGFAGAFHHGSTMWLSDDALLPPASDVDVMVVLAGVDLPPKLGTFAYRGVTLEVSFLGGDRLQSAEGVLADYHLAGSFRMPSIIADPSGRLTRLQAAIAEGFAARRWVDARCDHAAGNVRRYLRSLDQSAPFPNQVNAWLFASGVLTHVLLVAGLKNPTVRRRYLAAKELLAEYGHSDFYERLLEPLGCLRISPAGVGVHLDALADAFDAAKTVVRSPFPFATDISDSARPISIGGSRDLIERGYHREAIFWIVATYTRVVKVLDADAPPSLRDAFTPGYRRLLADLGITSSADLHQRCAQVAALLPRVREMADAIIAANPAIGERPAGTAFPSS